MCLKIEQKLTVHAQIVQKKLWADSGCKLTLGLWFTKVHLALKSAPWSA